MTSDELLALSTVFVVTCLLIWLVQVAESNSNDSDLSQDGCKSGARRKHSKNRHHHHHHHHQARAGRQEEPAAAPSLREQQWNVSSFFVAPGDERRQ